MTIYDLINLCIHYECQQDKKELRKMLDLLKDKTSLLEVGSNFGGSLFRMSEVMLINSKIVSIDLPTDFSKSPMDTLISSFDPVESLKMNCRRISQSGHHVELFLGDSHEPETVQKVLKFAPFDFVFIDGDHSYEGVKQDWLNYGPMGKVVGFHDIAGPVEGCVKFWNELKAESLNEGKFKFDEFINPGSDMGIGIIYRE